MAKRGIASQFLSWLADFPKTENTEWSRGGNLNGMGMKSNYKNIASLYEETRPSYPVALIEDIVKTVAIDRESNVLEIGAGTGKATVLMIMHFKNITCVEPTVELYEILQKKMKNTTCLLFNLPFEEYSTNTKYDLIYSAQAFHWIDKNIKYQKTFDLLKDRGYLILFWYVRMEDNIELKKLISSYLPGSNQSLVDYIHTVTQEINGSGLFEIKSMNTYFENKPPISSQEYIGQVESISGFQDLDEPRKDGLRAAIRELVGPNTIETKLEYVMFILKKSSQRGMASHELC